MEIFDPRLHTCLRTDWSKAGMGYFLCQKVCQCEGADLACCRGGWRICLAGSRFNSGADSRYAPIEGEAQAVAWALEQTKFFTVTTDHKPLISLLGEKSLDQVPNVRLFRIKQRISIWKFDIVHCPGKTNFFADATSRHPILAKEDNTETAILAANLAAIAISIDEIAAAAKEDDAYQATYLALSAGEAPVPSRCKEYHQYRDKLYPRDGVLMYDDRLVVPDGIRDRVLDVLHAAHQGRSSMLHRAAQTVFWPGYTADIEKR